MSDPWALSELDRRLGAMLQVGTVESVDHGSVADNVPPTVRVRVGEWVSRPLPMPAGSGGRVRLWNPLSVGEQVVLGAPSGELAQAYVISRHYVESHGQAPDDSGDTFAALMPDGTLFRYNHATGAFAISGAKSGTLSMSEQLTIDSPRVVFTGEIQAAGDITSDGDVKAGDISLGHHDHTTSVGPPT